MIKDYLRLGFDYYNSKYGAAPYNGPSLGRICGAWDPDTEPYLYQYAGSPSYYYQNNIYFKPTFVSGALNWIEYAVCHELGHQIDDKSGDSPFQQPGEIEWSQGWADFFSISAITALTNDTPYIGLEYLPPSGVDGALWDINDNNVDGTDNFCDGGLLWNAAKQANTFPQFYEYYINSLDTPAKKEAARLAVAQNVPLCLITLPFSNITTSSVTLNGKILTIDTAATTNVSFEWANHTFPYPSGYTPTYSNSGTLAPNAAHEFSFDLTGLSPNTQFCYRATNGTNLVGDFVNILTESLPYFALTVNSTTGGTVSAPAVTFSTHLSGSVVTITAVPIEGFSFVNWSGDTSSIANVNSASTTIIMNSNKTITANFTTTIQPHPTLVSPNGGENWYVGSTYNIGYYNPTSEQLTTELSRNGGGNWETLTLGPNNAWTVTGPDTTQALIRVSYNLSSYPYFYDVSDSCFTISSYGTAPPTVTTGSASCSTINTAAVNGSLTGLGTASSVNVFFEYGIRAGIVPDPSWNYTATVNAVPAIMTGAGAFSANLTPLQPNTTYIYRVKAVGDGKIAYGGGMTFTTPPFFMPTVATVGLTAQSSTAVFSGNLTSTGTSLPITVSFLYGVWGGPFGPPSSECLTGETPSIQVNSTGAFTIPVSNLPLNPYVYCAKATANGCTTYGDIYMTAFAPVCTVTANAGNGGTISPSGTVQMSAINNTNFLITPNSGYNIASVVVDGASIGPVSFYTFTDFSVNHTIVASFYAGPPPSVTTNVPTNTTLFSATLNGTINSFGPVSSANVAFDWGPTTSFGYSTAQQLRSTTGVYSANISGLTPSTIYYYRAVMYINGGAVYGATQTIVSQAYDPPMVTTNANPIYNPSGGATLAGNLYYMGNVTPVQVGFVYGPWQGPFQPIESGLMYTTSLQSMSSTGNFSAYIGSQPWPCVYAAIGISNGHQTLGAVQMTWGPPPPMPIIASAGTGGSISPSGSVLVPQGTNQAFTITPSAGYAIANVLVDGTSVGAVSSYTFVNVVSVHTISASFTPVYTITASAGAGGSISPTGSTQVSSGGSRTYTITPNANYLISSVVVDGVSQGAIGSYTFSNVAANHVISASFIYNAQVTITISDSIGMNYFYYVINATTGAPIGYGPGTYTVQAGTLITLNALYPPPSVACDYWDTSMGTMWGPVCTFTINQNMWACAHFYYTGWSPF
ncbi:MAG: hypothetical protein PHE50_05870 [Dehalococcoidales bacterium]|nr:hypothetical protein [Dehalococcoidales bacterium]